MIVVNGTDEPQNIGAGMCVVMFTNSRAKSCIGVFEKGSDAPSQIFVYPKVEYDNSFPCAQIIQLLTTHCS